MENITTQNKIRLDGKRICIIGAGKSGEAAARLCISANAEVTVTDLKPLQRPTTETFGGRFSWRCGSQDSVLEENWDIIVISPGVRSDLPALIGAKNRGALILGETEFAWRLMDKHPLTVGITGTNGKSTTTKLTGLMLALSGKNTFVGGNIGVPLSTVVETASSYDAFVLELSSFQIETLDQFKPNVSILLNIAPDHLDRYANENEYIAAKGRLFKLQAEDGVVIMPHNDANCERAVHGSKAKRYYFGDEDLIERCAFRNGTESFTIKTQYRACTFTVGSPSLGGRYNVDNAMASALAAHIAGASDEAIQNALNTYEGLPHRRALVAQIGEVNYYDDSKATNVHASVATIKSFPARDNIILIAGGMLKENDLQALSDAVRGRVKRVLCIGRDGKIIAEALKDSVQCDIVETMERAIARAAAIAHAGDVVLLAPATASFDAYKNYAERGDHFAMLVNDLKRPVTTKAVVKEMNREG